MIDYSMLGDFIPEAVEHLEELERSLLRLEEKSDDREALDDAFRAMHNIKGTSQFVGLEGISELSHKLENLLDLIRTGKRRFDERVTELLIEGKDRLTLLVNELERSKREETDITDLLARINAIADDRVDGRDETEDGEKERGAKEDNSEFLVEKEGHEEDVLPPAPHDEGGHDVRGMIPALYDETLSEQDCDEELHEIFMQQLKEHISFLQAESTKLTDSSNQVAILNNCVGVIHTLRSSANYMGYERLTNFCSTWLKAISEAKKAIQEERKTDLRMQDYINEVVRVYPQALENQGVLSDIPGLDVDEKDECALPDLNDALDTLFRSFEGTEAEEKVGLVDSPLDDGFALPDLNDAVDTLFSGFEGTEAEEKVGLVISPLEDEAFGEKYDEELFSIFMQQLRENIPFLQSQIDGLPVSGNRKEALKACRNAISKLKSSSNYMGYGGLTRHYSAWQEMIDGALKQLDRGEEPELSFMQTFIAEVIRVYPGCMEPVARGGEEALIEAKTRRDEKKEELKKTLENVLEKTDPLTDGADRRVEPQGLTAAPAPLENETADEGYDKELLTIFYQQLKDKLSVVQDLLDELAIADDKTRVLQAMGGALDSLKASANYMGYEKLAGHFSDWRKLLDASCVRLTEGKELLLPLIRAYLDEVLRVYPQAISAKIKKAVEVGGEKSETGVQGPNDSFVALSNALDATIDQTSNSLSQPIDDILGELIGSRLEAIENRGPANDELPVETDNRPDTKIKGHGLEKEKNSVLLPAQIPVRLKEEEMAADKSAPVEMTGKIENPVQKESETKKVKPSMRVDTDKIDFLMNQVGELVVSRSYFSQLYNEMRGLQQGLQKKFGLTKRELKDLSEFAFRLGEAGVALGRVSNELQEGLMKVRMLPVDQLFKRFPRLVRDLVHKTSKKVNFVTRGEETELDKMVIEEISDPLIHLIRNAIDHGIEPVEERRSLGKPDEAMLVIEAYHESDHIVIDVTDDGRGFDEELIKATALAKGLYTSADLNRISSLEIKHLVMQPGFSTAEKATKTSGRGVGMDVVRRNIEKLNGSVEIDTERGKGTRIRVKIPLTMAIIQVLMVRVGKEKFNIPLNSVEETLRVFLPEITQIEGVDVIHIRNSTMPIFKLSDVFGIRRQVEDDQKLFVVVVSTGLQEIGLVVDELLGQEEVVIKPLVDYLQLGSGFSGATILGDGGISLILDIPELVKMTTEKQISRQKRLASSRRLKRGTQESVKALSMQ